MQTVNSVSGGETSAYIAANYKADHNVFSLVRIEDAKAAPKDKKIIQIVSDKIGCEFIATAEDDIILYTMLDLEQYIGQEIKWVTGITFDEVIRTKGGWLPNKLHRYCTSYLKVEPIFNWWRKEIGDPITTRIGYRANEMKRANSMLSKLNQNGFLEQKSIVGKRGTRNKWDLIEWQRPEFPLIADQVFKDDIQNYWQGKPVRFANQNNCVGCFHRNSTMLRKMFHEHLETMEWFERQEGGKNGYWRSDLSYAKIKNLKLQNELFPKVLTCSAYCGI